MKTIVFELFTLLLTAIVFISFVDQVSAETAEHVVISEIQIGGDASENPSLDEFVELYNPTDNNVDLTGFKLMKKTAGASEFSNVVILSGSISSRGYFLIGHTNYNGTVLPDQTYDADSFSSNNTVALVNSEDQEIDKVGYGGAGDFETAVFSTNPASNRSIERKATSTSTQGTMEIGGEDEILGNGEDTDVNNDDFVYRSASAGSDPQNSFSQKEPIAQDESGISTVEIISEKTTAEEGSGPFSLTAVVRDPEGEEILDGLSYEWGISSDNGIGSLDPLDQKETEFTPLNEGDGDVSVIVRLGDEQETGSVKLTITENEEIPTPTVTVSPTSTPTPTLTPTPTPSPVSPRSFIGMFPLSRTLCYLEYQQVSFGRMKVFWPKIVCVSS